MAAPLAITPRALAEAAIDGSGDAVDLWSDDVPRSAVELELRVTAITTSVLVQIETSPDSSSWRKVGAFTKATVVGFCQKLSLTGLERYIRQVHDVTGACTFSVLGTAYQLYAGRENLPACVTDEVVSQVEAHRPGAVAEALIAGSSDVEIHVANANPTPLTALHPSLRKCAAQIAAYYVLTEHALRGGGIDELVVLGHKNAMDLLKRIQKGEVVPPNTTPADELGPRAESGNPDDPTDFKPLFTNNWGSF